MILLRARYYVGGRSLYKVVACVSEEKYISSAEHPRTPITVSATLDGQPLDAGTIGHIDYDYDESVVKFIGHWVHERDASTALNASLPINMNWIAFFAAVFKFYVDHEEQFFGLHDSLMDILIGWMRIASYIEDTESMMKDVYSAIGGHELDHQQYSKIWSSSQMIELLAAVHMHYDIYRSSYIGDKLDLAVKVQFWALHEYRKARAVDDFTKLPQDPLADDFDQYCLYHNHEEDGTCYRTKQR